MNLIKHASTIYHPAPIEIVYSYGVYNDCIPQIEAMNVKTVSGLISEEDLSTYQKPLLYICDDLIDNVSESYLDTLFIKLSHHLQMGVVFTTQSLFSKKLRVAKKNVHYYVLLRSPSDAQSIKNLGIQLFPNQSKFFWDSYKKAVAKLYSYLLVDLHPSSSSELRLRSNIFPPEITTVYQPKVTL
uniref:TraD/TraG TraM recognition site domain-containing protein n=1 Tax=Panagrolaimus sp. PS1159 TaxID=55785 RepID=A0AC35FMH4_9BILA